MMERHGIAYRARTPEQKREVIERMYALWQAHPDLRLGQLITNAFRDCYYTEDFDLIDTLEQFYQCKGEEAQCKLVDHTCNTIQASLRNWSV